MGWQVAVVNPPLRIGALGAARIARHVLVKPSREVGGVMLAAVAARDPARARRFAARFGIPRVHETYDDLLADPELDAVYVPLPNSLHAIWSIRALRAGKHVLCEKPLAANEGEARAMAVAAEAAGRVLMEALHFRYHPLAARMKDIVTSGELGEVGHLEAEFSVPLLAPWSIQFRHDLGGGATMDVGSYTIHLLRHLAGAEPQVVAARARLIRPQVDRAMTGDLTFPDGRTARMRCALLSSRLFRLHAVVRGTEGRLDVRMPFLPHIYHRLTVRARGRIRHARVDGPSTYVYQLRAFRAAVLEGRPLATDGIDGTANLRVIDAVYRAAGLLPRRLDV